MAKIFRPTPHNLPPAVLRTLSRKRRWHEHNGYGPTPSLTKILKSKVAISAGSFLLLIGDGARQHHGNAAITVFNQKGRIVDDRIWFNSTEGKHVPKKAFIGTPIVDGSKPMRYRPLHKKDSVFKP